MRLPPARRHAGRERGFTLIEIVVVVVIIGVLASLAVLRLPKLGSGGAQLDEHMQRITTLLDMASEEALMQGRDMGLRVEEELYEFYVFDPDAYAWVSLESDDLFKPRSLPDGMRMELFMEGQTIELGEPPDGADDDDREEADTVQPQVVILASGELTPFEMVLESETADYSYLIKGLPFGGTEVELEERGF